MQQSMETVPYAIVCDSLMYAMVATRPDIAHVGVRRFMVNTDKAHCKAIKLIIRYLKGTKSNSLCYGKGSLDLHKSWDSDMEDDVDTCKPTSGYVFTLVGSTVVPWSSRLQGIVALSTTETK